MERKIDGRLLKWKHSLQRMPLLISGARQVGKTYSALMFGKMHYRNTVYFNLEDSKELAQIFERDLDPARIINELATKCGQSIFPEDTLIIFDEVQACERALLSLKYFCENARGYHIIATGSLLGVALNRDKYSFPVGKVDMLTLYPLDFEEFLWAFGERDLGALIKESFVHNAPLSLHETALFWYKTYLVVGGMPRAVADYVATSDFNFVLVAQKSLNDGYIADMAKYASPQETTRIMAVWASLPAQLAKENRKFQYRTVKSGARASTHETALNWLKAAGMVNWCLRVSQGQLPLAAYADNDSFKIYLTDTGLLCAKFGLPPGSVINTPPSLDGFKGALAENYVAQVLLSNGFTPYYWSSEGKAEVDFVIQDRAGNIIPVEVKSSENVRSKSLQQFITRYRPEWALRISPKNFGYHGGIKSIPLYAVYCLEP